MWHLSAQDRGSVLPGGPIGRCCVGMGSPKPPCRRAMRALPVASWGNALLEATEGTINRSGAMFADWCAQEGLTVMDIEIEIPQPGK